MSRKKEIIFLVPYKKYRYFIVMKKIRQKTTVILLLIVYSCILHTQQIQHRIRIVCDDWKPYQFSEQGVTLGYSYEVILYVTNNLNTEIQSIDMLPWKRAVEMIKNNKTDALFSANYTNDRAIYAYYPEEPLIISPWVIWTHADSIDKFSDLSDLRGKAIGIVRGYSYTEEFNSYIEKYCIVEETTYDKQNFMKLEDGRLDYIVAEYGNGSALLKELGFNNIFPWLDNPIKTDGLYIIFNKRTVSPEFTKKFSDKTKEFKKTEQFRGLLRKYFGSNYNFIQP